MIKRVCRLLMPPIFFSIINRIRYFIIHRPINLRKLEKIEKLLPLQLVDEMKNYLESPDAVLTSRYWGYLIHKHLQQISHYGMKNYGNTVAGNYFTWKELDEIQLVELFSLITDNSDLYRIQIGMSFNESIQHNIILDMLYKYVSSKNELSSVLKSNSFKSFLHGNSPYMNFDGKFVTQDLLNSIIEYNNFSISLKESTNPKILEIGAGSGRTADLILTLHPGVKYIVVDIPPASYISRVRLETAHPTSRIQNCSSKAALKSILTSDDFDVLFIPPSLSPYLPNQYFDLMLAVDCLHEMNTKTRLLYSNMAARVSKFFYVKIWKKAYIPIDKERIDSSNLSSYGFRSSWKILRSENSIFPSNMCEYLFQIG